MSRPRIPREVEDEAVRLYRIFTSTHVARLLGISHQTVLLIVRRRGGRTRGRNSLSPKCIDCLKPISAGKRCRFHRKIARAAWDREYRRRKAGAKRPYLDNL